LLLLPQGTARIIEQLRIRLETSLQKLQADDVDEATKEEVSITAYKSANAAGANLCS
jgi:hypothetical protein